MPSRSTWPKGVDPTTVWARRSPPKPAPAEVLLPITSVSRHGEKSALQIHGSVVAPKGGLNGAFIGPTGYVMDFEDATDLTGYGEPGAPGKNGSDGSNGANGWTPVLLPEADGTRTLLKVSDWMNGTGTKPSIGGYLAAGGYVANKADAFNFNRAKRLESYGATTVASGLATIVFSTAFAAAPRILATARNAITGQPMVPEIVSVSTTQCVIRVSQSRATLVNLLNSLFNVVVGAQVDVIAVEA